MPSRDGLPPEIRVFVTGSCSTGGTKKFEMTEEGPRVATKKNGKPVYDLSGADEKSFATDCWSIVPWSSRTRQEKLLRLMLALPDPHGPNIARRFYDTMYDHPTFQQPVTMRKVLAALQNRPGWVLVPPMRKS